MSDVVWTTRRGDKLTMNQISDDHLANIIRFLHREAQGHLRDGYVFMSALQGEMALDAAHSGIDTEHQRLMDGIEMFEQEARRRKRATP